MNILRISVIRDCHIEKILIIINGFFFTKVERLVDNHQYFNSNKILKETLLKLCNKTNKCSCKLCILSHHLLKMVFMLLNT